VSMEAVTITSSRKFECIQRKLQVFVTIDFFKTFGIVIFYYKN
jgi:hypothetical protein